MHTGVAELHRVLVGLLGPVALGVAGFVLLAHATRLAVTKGQSSHSL